MRWYLIAPALLVACSSSPSSSTDAAFADAAVVSSDADALPSADADLTPDAFVSDADAEPAPDADPGFEVVYAGSRDDQIYRYVLDRNAGTLDPRGTTPAGNNPSFLAVDPTHRFLYAVNESTPRGSVAAFAIDAMTGDLTFLNRVSSEGSGPAHVSVDAMGRFVLVANYGDGAIAILPINADGSLGDAVDTDNPGNNAHAILTDRMNRNLFVPCLGANLVAQFTFDALTGAIAPNTMPSVASIPGAGPRHMAFHPSARFAYVINELDSTITSYAYDEALGQLTTLATISTLPVGFGGGNSTAEVFAHPNGAFVYGSNRGHDSIAVFSVDDTSGELTLIANTPTGGSTPRNFGLTADGAMLLAANQGSGDIHAFRVDAATGLLEPLGRVAQLPGPAYVGIFRLTGP